MWPRDERDTEVELKSAGAMFTGAHSRCGFCRLGPFFDVFVLGFARRQAVAILSRRHFATVTAAKCESKCVPSSRSFLLSSSYRIRIVTEYGVCG
jgi:hypothetical protein